MKDKRSLHLRVQEFCDCFATAEPLGEMLHVKDEADKEEGALKWLALALLHGINYNAKKVTISRTGDGQIRVTAKYREAELPSPDSETGRNIIEALKSITHMDGEEGKIPLALGIRDSSLELQVKMEHEKDCDKVTIKFPK